MLAPQCIVKSSPATISAFSSAFSYSYSYFQILGPKPDLPDAHSEDEKTDVSNRKMAKLYKVSFFFTLFKIKSGKRCVLIIYG